MKQELYKIIQQSKIIPIIRENSYEKAYSKSLLAVQLGFKIIEITYTIPKAGMLIQKLHQQFPHLIIGAGTILTMKELKNAIAMKANFIVAPNLNLEIAKACKKQNIFYIPGAFSPTEVIAAYQLGALIIKIFPASILGPNYFKAIKSVLPPQVSLMATGGIEVTEMAKWQKQPIAIFGLGSKLFEGNEVEIKKRIKKLQEVSNV